MAEPFSFGGCLEKGSNKVLPECYCEPCNEFQHKTTQANGHCIDCGENFCFGCFMNHPKIKQFKKHKLVHGILEEPRKKRRVRKWLQNATEKCSSHYGAIIQSFCKSHSELCCKGCLMIYHKTCDVEDITKMAKNLKDPQELLQLNKKLKDIQKGIERHLDKTGHRESEIEKNFTDAINDMKKLRDDIDKMMNETQKLAEKMKEGEFNKVATVTSNCKSVIEQINTMSSNLEILKEKKENERLFISMKRAESELQSLEKSLSKLEEEGSVREYKFEPDERLQAMMEDLKVLGQLTFIEQGQSQSGSSYNVATIREQLMKRPVHVKDIHTTTNFVSSFTTTGSVALANNTLLITDYQSKKIKQFETIEGTLIAELTLPGNPFDIAEYKPDNFAVTIDNPNKIQLVSITKGSLQNDTDIPVNGKCHGIAYNDRDETFVVTFQDPLKVEIIDMTGTVLKTIEKDSNGIGMLLTWTSHVALSPDRKRMYVTISYAGSVKELTMDGEVKATYKDSRLHKTGGIYVHSSGVVYVVGRDSCTVQQIEPASGEIKTILEQKDGLEYPWSISYCEKSDKLYVGMHFTNFVKVFDMK